MNLNGEPTRFQVHTTDYFLSSRHHVEITRDFVIEPFPVGWQCKLMSLTRLRRTGQVKLGAFIVSPRAGHSACPEALNTSVASFLFQGRGVEEPRKSENSGKVPVGAKSNRRILTPQFQISPAASPGCSKAG